MVKARSPSSTSPPSWTPRRSVGGARVECTERVLVRAPGFETTGWTLNVSRGGLRAVLEQALSLGVEYEVFIGDAAEPRRILLVWSQEQADGQIVGLKYADFDGSVPPKEGSVKPREE